MEVLTFSSIYMQKLTNFLKETPNKIYLLCSQNCPSFNHHILKCAKNLEDIKAVIISNTSLVTNSMEIKQHTTKLKTNFIVKDNFISLEFSTNLAIQDNSNFVLPILNMGKIHKQVRQKAIPALTKIGIEDELSLTTLFIMRKETTLKHYVGHRGWPCFSSTPIIFKEEEEGPFAREPDNIVDHCLSLEAKNDNVESDSEDSVLGYCPTNLFIPSVVSQPSKPKTSVVSQPSTSGTPVVSQPSTSGTPVVSQPGKLKTPLDNLTNLFIPSVVSQPIRTGTPLDCLNKTQENDWVETFHTPPENRNKNKFYPKEWGTAFLQTITSIIIQDPKFIIIMLELIKHTASNKLKEMKTKIKDQHQDDFDKLKRSSDFYSHPSEPRLSCFTCQYRFNTPQGASNHKRACKGNNNHINRFLDDYVLRHFNITEIETNCIKDTIAKVNKFNSTKHYEEAYQQLINSFWSQIKYALTSLQPCMFLTEDRDLIKTLLISMLNFQETETDIELTVEKDDFIGRVLEFLESSKVR